MPALFGKFQNAVVWGVKGKILCPAGCQNPVARITKAKEILKNPRPAGSWRPLKCIFSGKGKSRSQRAAKPRSGVILAKEKDSTQRAGSPVLSVLCTEEPDRNSLRQLQSKFLPRCQNPQFCGFVPRGKLVGECLPQTLLWRLAPQKDFRSAGRFFARTAPEIPNRPAYFL